METLYFTSVATAIERSSASGLLFPECTSPFFTAPRPPFWPVCLLCVWPMKFAQ